MKTKLLVIISLCSLTAAVQALPSEMVPEHSGASAEPAWPESDLDPKWGTDVLISSYDSVFSVSLARDPSSGNLFAVLSRINGTSKGVSVHFSSNGGLNWSNTMNSSSTGRGVSAAMVMGNYCYYAYSVSGGLRLDRVSCATGANVTMGNGANFVDILTTTTDTITEVSMAELYNNTQLCLATIHKNGKYRLFWTYDTGGVNWTQMASPDSIAKGGLDIYGNYPYSNYLLFSTYFNQNNQLKILGLGPGGVWDTLQTSPVLDQSRNLTAVGAYRDTVLAAFEYKVSGLYYIRAAYSANGGSTWNYSTLTGDNCLCPDLAMNGGGGIGFVFAQDWPQPRFNWWPYSGGSAASVLVSSRVISLYQPEVEYLGIGAYGMAYISDDFDLNRAYFDRSNWVTGEENDPELPAKVKVEKLKLTVMGNIINYQLPQSGQASIKVYNLLGQEVRNLANGYKNAGAYSLQWDGRDANDRLVSSGVYLVRLVSWGQAATARMVVAK